MNKQDLFNINPKYSTTAAFILGLILTDNLSAPEQNMLGNWILLIGQTVLTNAGSQNLIETRIQSNNININSKEIKSLYNPIIYDINKIKEIINKLYPNNKKDLENLSKYLETIKNKIDKIKD